VNGWVAGPVISRKVALIGAFSTCFLAGTAAAARHWLASPSAFPQSSQVDESLASLAGEAGGPLHLSKGGHANGGGNEESARPRPGGAFRLDFLPPARLSLRLRCRVRESLRLGAQSCCE